MRLSAKQENSFETEKLFLGSGSKFCPPRRSLGRGGARSKSHSVVILYSAGFDFVAALFRLRGGFRDFGAAPLRTARAFCSCSEADAARWRRSLRSLRSCFWCK